MSAGAYETVGYFPTPIKGFYGRYKSSPEQKARRRHWKRRNRHYRHLLKGTGGILANGVRWWFAKPRHEQDKSRDRLLLCFNDPCSGGIVASGYFMNNLTVQDIEEQYQRGIEEHSRLLEIRHLKPAEPGDPKAFLVRWRR